MKRKSNKKPTRKPIRRTAKSHAIVPAPPPVTVIQNNRERRLRPEEIELLKKTVAKGTTDDEFLYFMTVCRKHRVDPFTKQIYCIVWPTKNGTDHELVILMGIGGYRMTAARDHKDFAGTSKPEFTWFDPPKLTPAGKKIPESCSIYAKRKGMPEDKDAGATVYWEEFAPDDLNGERPKFWRTKPKHMLAKVAESHAIRKEFPDLSDIFTEEEMAQRMHDLSEGGREVFVDGVSPSGMNMTAEKVREQAKLRQQNVVDQKLKDAGAAATGYPPGSPEAKQAQATLDRVEQADAAFKNAKNVTPKPLGDVVIDYSEGREQPIVRGDLSSILEMMQERVTLVWKNGWWRVAIAELGKIRALCIETNYRCVEYTPPPPKGSGKPEAKPENKTKSGGRPSATRGETGGANPPPTLVTGNLDRCVAGMTSTKQPMQQLRINNIWYACYRNSLFEHFANHMGYVVEVFIDKNKAVAGIKRVGKIQFEADGKTPVALQKDREPGGTLFK